MWISDEFDVFYASLQGGSLVKEMASVERLRLRSALSRQHQQHDFLKVIFFHEKTTHEDSNIIYSKSNMHSMQKCMYVTERIFPRFPDLQIDCFQVTSKCVCTNHSLSSFSTAFFSMMNALLFCYSHNKIE